MRNITEEELKIILDNHQHWLAEDCDGWEKMRADLSNTDLSNTNLSNTDLRFAKFKRSNLNNANLSNAKLRYADLRYADLRYTNLNNTDLIDADLSDVDISEAKNLLSSIDYLKENFEFTEDGVIAYKIFNVYSSPEEWVIQSGSIITENCNPNRTDVCGCGINVAPLEWVRNHCKGEIWKLLIRWEWLVGVVVPYNTDGKIRCERAELIEIVETNEE